ncbi:MAG: virulence factor [Gammaproteobacteria bacterium]|nr:virulence factor [Gammaproteobacteria bacterium]
MAKLITVYWRDIPSQVMVRVGRETTKVMLSQRFQEAIDRAAMRAGKGSSDLYLAEWHRTTGSCSGDPQTAANSEARRLEAAYDDARLESLVKSKGEDLTAREA